MMSEDLSELDFKSNATNEPASGDKIKKKNEERKQIIKLNPN